MMAARKWLDSSHLLGGLVAVVIGAAVWFQLRTTPLAVDLATVTRGAMAVSIDELGETRVRDLYTVSAPVTGELLRIPFKPGAAVVGGKTVLAAMQPAQPGPIDARSYAQTLANIAALEAQYAAARARVREMQAAATLAKADYERVTKLVPGGFVTRARVDQARAEMMRSAAAVNEAIKAEDAALHAVEAARAGLDYGGGNGGAEDRGGGARRIDIRAPVSGTVLRVLQESRRPVVAGTPLIEIGDPDDLEITVDLLTEDAVKVRPGALASIDGWGGEQPLAAVVRLVEPLGFTKVSALGVEEQRVNVLLDFADPAAVRGRLGHGYRVMVHIGQWAGEDVLRVPLGALFRDGEAWASFVVDADGRARKRRVTIGRRNDDFAEVLGGLSAGARVVLHPSDKLEDGREVRGRR